MFQVSISNPTAMLHPVVMIQPVMYTRDLEWYTGYLTHRMQLLASKHRTRAVTAKPEGTEKT